jgi:hypothetical protein
MSFFLELSAIYSKRAFKASSIENIMANHKFDEDAW